MKYIDLNTIINYWRGQKHEGDKGGNFNLDDGLHYYNETYNK